MKFRFYIIDIAMGNVVGTDDSELANAYALSEENFVVDTETGYWIQADLDQVTIEAADDFR